MPSKKRNEKPALPALEIKPEVHDQLVQGPLTPEQFETMFRGLKKAIVERALGAELTHHLGYSKGDAPPAEQSNHRNGTSPKTVLTDGGSLDLAIPRDREGSFEPQLIAKGERRFQGFDAKVIAMYARGMTVREIQGYLEEMYGIEVSPDFISQVTEAVMAEKRPLATVCLRIAQGRTRSLGANDAARQEPVSRANAPAIRSSEPPRACSPTA